MKPLYQPILKNRYSSILSLYISHTYFRKMFQCYLHPIKNTIDHQQLQLPDNFVVTSNNKLQVTVHDVLCLANYTYLNDIVINYILQAHHNEADRPDIYLIAEPQTSAKATASLW